MIKYCAYCGGTHYGSHACPFLCKKCGKDSRVDAVGFGKEKCECPAEIKPQAKMNDGELKTDKLVPVSRNMLREIQETIYQSIDCINGAAPEDMSREDARQDTLSKLKAAEMLLEGADAFASLMPTPEARSMKTAQEWTKEIQAVVRKHVLPSNNAILGELVRCVERIQADALSARADGMVIPELPSQKELRETIDGLSAWIKQNNFVWDSYARQAGRLLERVLEALAKLERAK